jgi:hypothetical protein
LYHYYFVFTAYIKAAAALCVVCLLTDIAATILTGLGLRTQDHRDKHKYYRFAVFSMGIACKYLANIYFFFRVSFHPYFYLILFVYLCCISVVSLLIALIIYPICFAAELNLGKINLLLDLNYID